jgi:citrate lyase beta subunit
MLERLSTAQSEFEQRYPGDSTERQPVHVVYGGAQRFRADTSGKFGALALQTLSTYAPDPDTLAGATGLSRELAEAVYPRVVAKLESEPIEDYRIDFEDGYGYRSDAEEDEDARKAARELAEGERAQTLPPFIGIRVKPLSRTLAARAIRTLKIFFDELLTHSSQLPANFAVTLPKVIGPEQVAVLDSLLLELEARFRLARRVTRVELMIETPQVIVNHAGVSAIPALIAAAQGRCRSIHFGPYDYTFGLNIAGPHQSLSHPACDWARQQMLTAAAGTGVSVSDGPTKLLPVPVHRTPATDKEDENRAAVHRGMKAHCDDIARALRDGIYQGWDLHPAQLPTRYAATYAFFLGAAPAAAARLKNFMNDARQATLLGNLFDDAASGQGLLNLFLRGYACGAYDESDIAATGLTLNDIRERSFERILERRRNAAG